MFKMGQKVKLTDPAYGPPGADTDDTYTVVNITHDGLVLMHPRYGHWGVPVYAVRPLMKKKPAPPKIMSKVLAPITLKGEIDWMNKIQKNFRSSGYRHNPSFFNETMEQPVDPRGQPMRTTGAFAIRNPFEDQATPNDDGLREELARQQLLIEHERRVMEQQRIGQQRQVNVVTATEALNQLNRIPNGLAEDMGNQQAGNQQWTQNVTFQNGGVQIFQNPIPTPLMWTDEAMPTHADDDTDDNR